MTDSVLAPAATRAAANPWVTAAIVVVPTFMEVLDTTIAVVALRYIAGGLSATVDDGGSHPGVCPCAGGRGCKDRLGHFSAPAGLPAAPAAGDRGT